MWNLVCMHKSSKSWDFTMTWGWPKNLFRYFVKCYRKTQTNFLFNEVESRVNSSLGYPHMSVCECLSLGLSIIVEESFNIMSGKLDGTCPWLCSGSKAGKGNERFSCLKCRFSLNSRFQCLVFSHLQPFFSVSLENQLLIFFRALSCGCNFRRGIWEDSILCYTDSKQALYFQSSTSLSSLVLPLRQVPLVSAGVWTGAYSAVPVFIQYFKLGRNEIFPNCSILSMVSFCGLLFLVHLHTFILSFCLYCIYAQRRNSFEANGKPPHLPGDTLLLWWKNLEKNKKDRKMPAQLITEVCKSTAR